MNIINFEQSLEKKYQDMRADMHSIINARPGSGIAKGIMELQLYKIGTLREKINFLENEIKTRGLKLGKITTETYNEWVRKSQENNNPQPPSN